MPGSFKLDHLQPAKPILFPRFSNFFTFILGAISYYPRGLIMRKGNSPNSQYAWCRGVSAPGAFKLDHLQPVKPILFPRFSNFFTFILGANSYYPRRLIMGKGNSPNSKYGWCRGVWVPSTVSRAFHSIRQSEAREGGGRGISEFAICSEEWGRRRRRRCSFGCRVSRLTQITFVVLALARWLRRSSLRQGLWTLQINVS